MTRRRAVALALCALGPLLVAAGCSGSDVAESEDSSASTTSQVAETSTTLPSEAPSCDGAIAAGTAPIGSHAVGRTSRTWVDTSRGTDADDVRGIAAAPTRTLVASVLYPAEGAPGAAGEFVDGAPPAQGAFPLVVYSHGVLSNGTERNDALARWASAGYVVVAPTFPLSSGPGARIFDLPNQPGDVVFVTEQFRAAVASPQDELHGTVASHCLALAGHSLGGATTLATAFDPCCGQLDARAVVDISGVLITVTPDAQLADAPPLPTLIVHGDADPLVPYAMGQRAFADLTGPRWFLTLQGGDHNSMFVPPESALLDPAVVGLFDAELKDDPALLDSLPAMVAAAGNATLECAPEACAQG